MDVTLSPTQTLGAAYAGPTRVPPSRFAANQRWTRYIIIGVAQGLLACVCQTRGCWGWVLIWVACVSNR
jgi:hypothetical protein